MIPITHIWLSTTPMDMRCGSGKLLAHIITEHQSIRPHCAYLFYNKAGTRLKVLIHDGLGVWLCSRQLDDNKFHGLTKALTTTKNASISKAMDYCLKRWQALTQYLDDGRLPIDNNWAENQMRPWALGRKNWLFAGSLRSGQRAANIMSIIQSARLNGLDVSAYLTDVLRRLPTQEDLDELLPHRWVPPQ